MRSNYVLIWLAEVQNGEVANVKEDKSVRKQCTKRPHLPRCSRRAGILHNGLNETGGARGGGYGGGGGIMTDRCLSREVEGTNLRFFF